MSTVDIARSYPVVKATNAYFSLPLQCRVKVSDDVCPSTGLHEAIKQHVSRPIYLKLHPYRRFIFQ